MANKELEKGAASESIEKVEEALGRTEKYIEENRKSLSIIVGVIILIIGGYLGWQYFYIKPTEAEAQQQMFGAERYFRQDSFKLALKGDGNQPGFIEIIDDYGVTKSANLAHYYAGVCYLHLGEYDKAIEFLKGFSTKSNEIGPIATGAIGDAYWEKNNLEEAISYYLKASEQVVNEFSTPYFLMKAGKVYEVQKNWAKAIEVYEKIQNQYPRCNEAKMIEKYIARAKAGK